MLLGLLLVTLTATSGCSSLVFRRGQPAIIGDIQPGTRAHVYVSNDAGQVFRLPRTSISGTRMGGMRTTLWSLLAGYGALILIPGGLIQWSHNVAAFDATDGAAARVLDVADEEEVDASGVSQ